MFDLKLYAKALETIPKRYLLVNSMSMRIRQLQGGAEPLVNQEGLSVFDIALKEIVEKKISIKMDGEEKLELATEEE